MLKPMKFLAALSVFTLASAAFAEQVDNPSYQNWAKYKPGSSLTISQSSTMAMMGGITTQATITQTLAEVTPTAVTLNVVTKTTVMGQSNEGKSTSVIPAKVEKGLEFAQPMPDMKVEIKDMKEGAENIDVKGVSVKAITREYTVITSPAPTTAPATNPAIAMMAGGMTMKIKTWTAAEVPGGVVKTEQNGTMGQMGEIKTTAALVDYMIVK